MKASNSRCLTTGDFEEAAAKRALSNAAADTIVLASSEKAQHRLAVHHCIPQWNHHRALGGCSFNLAV
jgi:DeoR/GlpR family transcriptional regulator of sugar metabolism